jgi:hypothetical protein
MKHLFDTKVKIGVKGNMNMVVLTMMTMFMEILDIEEVPEAFVEESVIHMKVEFECLL